MSRIAQARHSTIRFPRRRVLCALLLACFITAAWAGEDSNLVNAEYPSTTCSKPSKPFTPGELRNQSEVNQYRALVDVYNKRATAYTQCINAYLETAAKDVQRIQEKMDAAVAAANAP